MNKRAIIIGASSGIGREVAKLLMQEGWTIGVAARRIDKLQELSAAAVEQIDVTKDDATTRLQSLINCLGGMDLFFYASGIGKQNRELQEDIEGREFSATAGGGAVEVTITGKKTIKSLTLKPEVVDPEDIDMLQDLIISAVNEAINNVENTTETEMSKITGGVSLPGLF